MAGTKDVDPRTNLEVRPTDNGLHGTDEYPVYQESKPLFSGPDGIPYEYADIRGDGDLE